jgi:ATP synthase F1 delta subunit/ATP synthase F0 subunit b
MTTVLAASDSGGGNFLVSPSVGLMIWTLLAFGITLYLLNKLAFPRIAAALDRRRVAIEQSIDSAEQAKREADQLLEEYRARLREAREQAEDIVGRARKAGENLRDETKAEASKQREEMLAATRRDIEQETRRALEDLRREVADLTVAATEKITRKSLDEEDHRRLIDEALSEVDFSELAPSSSSSSSTSSEENGRERMEAIAEVYARSLFEVAKEHDVLDRVHDELGEFADALADNRDLQVFLFSPYFSSEEKREGVRKIVTDADERMVNFLELLAERHRMPALFRIRREFDALWADENKLLPVTVTSAVELDEGVVDDIGKRIQEQTGRKVELSSNVDPDVLGGLRLQVGNMVLDGTVRNRLERLRKQVAKAA